MQAADPLAQLHDIVLPQAVSWWPLAWGWWVLLFLLVATAAVVLFFRRRRLKRRSYRQQASHELTQIFSEYQREQNAARYLQNLSILLRRSAISAQPHTFPVDVKGEAWLQWLDNHCPETKRGFSTGAGRALLTGPYEANPQIDVDVLQALANLWLQRHRDQWQTTKATADQMSVTAEEKKHA